MDPAFFDGKKACCFTGHRPDALPAPGTADDTKLRLLLMDAVTRAAEAGVTRFNNGGARGFDLLCGEAVLAAKENGHPALSLHLYLPSPKHTEGWSKEDLARFARLSEAAVETAYAATANYPHAYLTRDRHLVDDADCCICYLKKMRGGTLYTVNYALDKNIPVMNLYDAFR
ncbi:MAG: SLOG family protein [Clostridia bacterium]|nr:SLOG family protein [Clostridia bacterium]